MKNSRPPLAYLISRYPAISHTFILREIAHLRRLGHTIHTASINPPDRDLTVMDVTEKQEALATYCVKSEGVAGAMGALAYWVVRRPMKLLQTLKQGLALGSQKKGLAYAVEAAMVARWMQSHGLAHLHVHFGNAGATVGMLVKTLSECHLSYTIHGPDEFDDVQGQHLPMKMAAANAVVCISQFAKSQLMRISKPNDWSKFNVCRLGVDPQQFTYVTPGGGMPRVRMLCVGRLTPAKGQVLLVQACAQLKDAGIDFSMVFVGDGPDRSRIETAIRTLGLADQVSLTGALTQEGVRRELNRADIFVLPSLAEGIPVVLMEAMSSGIPCVSTPVNGIPELIEHGRTGLLATPGDVDSLVAQLLHLARDESARKALACAAREKIEASFNLENNVRQLGDIFSGFAKTRPSHGR